jgi:hypothetical protein
MKKLLINLLIIVSLFGAANAQFILKNGDNNLTISTRFSTYAQRRFLLDSGQVSRRKDFININRMQLVLKGNKGKHIKYDATFDVAALIIKANDPQDPGILAANATYTGFKLFDITAGWDKVPYSRQNQVSFFESAFWRRPEITGGILFSRRDAGITLHKKLFHKLINLYGGIYTGLGEATLTNGNDPSGGMEYIARADFSYPTRYKYTEIDLGHSVVPMFSVGVNGRYANKILPTGTAFAPLSNGEFGNKVVNGEKYTYGADFAFQYQGFSFQAEIHQLKNILVDSLDANLQVIPGRILPVSFTNKTFYSGGAFVQANYHSKKLKSAFCVRYEQMNLNNFISGEQRRISFAYAYMLKGTNSMIKISFYTIDRKEVIDTFGYKQEVRLGWQVIL